MFQFTSAEDCIKILESGPWYILGKPLLIKKWDPRSKPKRVNLHSVTIFFKLSGLDLKFWDNEGLEAIGSYLGVPLYVDGPTATGSRLTFACICVEITPFIPLPDFITIETNDSSYDQLIEYDWKPDPCIQCQTLDHSPSSDLLTIHYSPSSFPNARLPKWKPVHRMRKKEKVPTFGLKKGP